MAQRYTKITAGLVTRIVVYPHSMPQNGKAERSAKQLLSSEARKATNDRRASEQFRLLCYANFRPLDPFATLTYDDEHAPESLEDVKKDIQRFNDKVRGLRRRRGQRYDYTRRTSSRD